MTDSNTKTIETLKACPFCGSGDVELQETITDAMIICNNCRGRTGSVYLGPSDESNAAKLDEVRSTWNTRPEPAQPDNVVEAIADGVAEAINSVSVAYSHQTSNKMQTMNHMWSVHDSCEGNPFGRDEWLGQFDNKEDANELAMKIRRERSIASVRKTLTALPSDDAQRLISDLAKEPPGGEIWERSDRFAKYAERAHAIKQGDE